MIYERVADLPSRDELAVIINVNTKTVASLALASALRYANMPVLVIDCESTDGSLEHFSAWSETAHFDVLSAPLRTHGRTLDMLFRDLEAEKVLLVDSDLEILDGRILEFLREFIDDPDTFGSGFVNGPGWLTDHAGTVHAGAYYQERIWMPIAMLKTSYVRQALAAGRSFDAHTVYNGLSALPVFRRLQERRRGDSVVRRLNKMAPRAVRQTYYGHRPSVVVCDTGADIYQYLRFDQEHTFVGLPERFHPQYVTHLFGTTRNALGDNAVHGGDRHQHNLETVAARLLDLYGTTVD